MKTIQLTLAPECGVTVHSTENAEYLNKRFGKPFRIEFYGDKNKCEYYVIATYQNGHSHAFTGFSWGYYGEGPTGLHRFLNETCGIHFSRLNIASLRFPTRYAISSINDQLND